MPSSIWFKHDYGDLDPSPDQKRFEALYIQLGAPREMMMISDKMVRTSVYVSLPNDAAALGFSDFHQVAEGELPQEVLLLAGNQEEFEMRFPPPTGP